MLRGFCRTNVLSSIAGVQSYPSSCPDNPNAQLYVNKERRYPEYVNTETFIDDALSHNAQKDSEEKSQEVLQQCHGNCEAQADIWINQLKSCNASEAQLAALKLAMIEICSKSCSVDRMFGASTLDPAVPATYHSFDEAIKGILGASAINSSCAAELISEPYPYDNQPVLATRVISETTYEICQKISEYRAKFISSGSSGSFHDYLLALLGNNYGLDSLELNDLLNSCTNCNGLLNNDIVLPVAFEPGASPCLLCDSMAVTMTEFNEKFIGLTLQSDNYEVLFSTFFNHKFGYSLTSDQYLSFIDSCNQHPGYAVALCNQPTSKTYEADAASNACMASLFATALTNASNVYIAYIDSVRKDFRDAYMSRCLNVQPRLSMTAELLEHHYTLYYYDQSGSLVKTIPPEGVQLLSSAELEQVKYHRNLGAQGCYQFSDSIKMSGNSSIAWNNVRGMEGNQFSVEMMLNLSSVSNQVLVSRITEVNFQPPAAASYFRHSGIIARVVSGNLWIDIYGVKTDNTQMLASFRSVRPLIDLLPVSKWNHLVIEKTGNSSLPLQAFINGNPVALQSESNNLSAEELYISNSASPLIAGSYNASQLSFDGMLTGSIKNLRVYDRLLTAMEIRQNAYNSCQLPAHQNGLVFWAPMTSARGRQVADLLSGQSGALTGLSWQSFAGIFPEHRLPTTYHYNSLGQVLQQYSPDADTAVFWYDRLGRLTASQNKEQKENASYSGSAYRFSYTRYDRLGRIVEAGEKSDATFDLRGLNMLSNTDVNSWLNSGTDRQVTKTVYDEPINSWQSYLTSRKRVVASVYVENSDDLKGDSTLYSYDINGNVNILEQHIKALVEADPVNGKKRMTYNYDLVSGKVNSLDYQPGKGDQFFYKYHYDADNRLVRAYTSRDKLIWSEDASYSYYLHGPLARMELGHLKVQGVDYAYTLQGWLKGINGDALDAQKEMGQDGVDGTPFSRVSRDAYAYRIGYHNNDYESIGGVNAPAFTQNPYSAPTQLAESGNQLFNGNISFTSVALSKIENGEVAGYSYGYDQLNRLTGATRHTVTGAWSNSSMIEAYKERLAYDANGNIRKNLRNGADKSGTAPDMDSLIYQYDLDLKGNLRTNKLKSISDIVSDGEHGFDIDNQPLDNYRFDKIGNLISDSAGGILTINWNIYGKIADVKKYDGTVIHYDYDPSGNRIYKNVTIGNDSTAKYYVKKPDGMLMAAYDKSSRQMLTWSEQLLYGISRIGYELMDADREATVFDSTYSSKFDSILFGSRFYELSNHLGNVMSVINNKKVGIYNGSNFVRQFIPELVSTGDYYSFGMAMPARQLSNHNYLFGFNGKENDNDIISGIGTEIDYGMRIYDPRVARFLSVDPLFKSFPWYTPYQFSGNSPIKNLDLDGLEEISYTDYWARTWRGEPGIRKTEWFEVDRGCACGTFATAAEYNTNGLESKLYKPINQIHNYYQWADRKLKSAGTDIRWFKAAEEVTAPLFGIGASQYGLGRTGGGFSKESQEFLAKGNSFLFERNMGMMKNILESGSFNGETGKAADYKMVEAEQTALSGFLKTYEEKIGSDKYNALMDNLNSALNEPLIELNYIKDAKKKIGGDIDFRIQEHREALGKSLIDQIRALAAKSN